MSLDLRRRLEDVEQWGCIIYRTVYTPESDQRWGEVVKRLDGLIIPAMTSVMLMATWFLQLLPEKDIGKIILKYGLNIMLIDKASLLASNAYRSIIVRYFRT